jgi:hypothetical protein
VTQTIEEYSIVAVYNSHVGAEAAVQALHKEGLDLKRLSIVGKGIETEDHALGFYPTGELVKARMGRGATWGAFCGLLFGGAFFLIPAIGPLVGAGPIASWILGALEAAAIGGVAGVIVTACMSIGIAKDSVVKYEHAVRGGKFAVVVHGAAEIVVHARAVLETTDPLRLIAHAA